MTEPTQVQVNPLVALDETIRKSEADQAYSRNRILLLSQRVFDLTEALGGANEANEQLTARIAELTGLEAAQGDNGQDDTTRRDTTNG